MKKKVKISDVILNNHFILQQMLLNGSVARCKPPSIESLSVLQLQALFDVQPIPVVATEQKNNYEMLAYMPLLGSLAQHPNKNKIFISLIIFTSAAELLPVFTLIKPALHYPERKDFIQNIHSHLQHLKAQNLDTPTQKQLADWANVSPSAIVKRKKNE